MKGMHETENYCVVILEEPKLMEQQGVTMELHYGVLNKNTDKIESYAQFQPSAIEQVDALDSKLRELLKDSRDSTGTVVSIN